MVQWYEPSDRGDFYDPESVQQPGMQDAELIVLVLQNLADKLADRQYSGADSDDHLLRLLALYPPNPGAEVDGDGVGNM